MRAFAWRRETDNDSANYSIVRTIVICFSSPRKRSHSYLPYYSINIAHISTIVKAYSIKNAKAEGGIPSAFVF